MPARFSIRNPLSNEFIVDVCDKKPCKQVTNVNKQKIAIIMPFLLSASRATIILTVTSSRLADATGHLIIIAIS